MITDPALARGPDPALRLRPLRPGDEEAFLAGHPAMAADGFTFGPGYKPGMPRTGGAATPPRSSGRASSSPGPSRLPGVLVTCDDSNIGSIAVIEACGGRLDDVIASAASGSRIRRYWID